MEPRIADRVPRKVELEEGKKYDFCTCGESQNQPFCDGAHKATDFTPHLFVAEKSGPAWLCMCKRTARNPFCDGTHNNLA